MSKEIKLKQKREIDVNKKKIFLETYIDTQNVAEASRVAGIAYPTGARIAKKYANMLEAQFEGIGLSRTDVMQKHADIIKNPPVKKIMSKFGVVENVDAGAHLKAIEMFYEITGLKKTSPEVVIVNDVKSEANVELEIFRSLPEDVKKSVRDKMINARKTEGENI